MVYVPITIRREVSDMNTMEGALQLLNPDLLSAYSRSYNMAVEQWLPQVVPKNDSVNSLPHLLGVKKRIDEILYAENIGVSVTMNDGELYVMLCSVLFHDIGKGVAGKLICIKGDRTSAAGMSDVELALLGRGVEQGGGPTCTIAIDALALIRTLPPALVDGYGERVFTVPEDLSKVHADISKEIIECHWAELGIVTERVARVVADICAFHDSDLDRELSFDYHIDGFGHVRARLLAALLMLGDQLDDTFTRITPSYIKAGEQLLPVARFRNKIQSTRIDKFCRMACTVIDSHLFSSLDLARYVGLAQVQDIFPEIEGDALYDYIRAHLGLKPGGGKGTVNHDSALYSIAKHTCENIDNLKKVRDELYVLGLPIKEWLVEYDGNLFKIIEDPKKPTTTSYFRLFDKEQGGEDCPMITWKEPGAKAGTSESVSYRVGAHAFRHTGREIGEKGSRFAIEPLFDLDYCKQLMTGMYRLEGGVFGKPYHKYTELLNYVREDHANIGKVRCAVHRIAKLLSLDKGLSVSLYCDDDVWMLSRTKDPVVKPDGIVELNDLIKYLADKVGAYVRTI